jgi:hypothetical protein
MVLFRVDMATVGATLVQGTKLISVVTLFEVTSAWLELDAVIEEVFDTKFFPALACTVNVTGTLAPGARTTGFWLSVDGVTKLTPGVVSLSFTVRLKVSSAQTPASLFVMVQVY